MPLDCSFRIISSAFCLLESAVSSTTLAEFSRGLLRLTCTPQARSLLSICWVFPLIMFDVGTLTMGKKVGLAVVVAGGVMAVDTDTGTARWDVVTGSRRFNCSTAFGTCTSVLPRTDAEGCSMLLQDFRCCWLVSMVRLGEECRIHFAGNWDCCCLSCCSASLVSECRVRVLTTFSLTLIGNCFALAPSERASSVYHRGSSSSASQSISPLFSLRTASGS